MDLGSFDYDYSVLSNYNNNEISYNGYNYFDENIDIRTNNNISISDIGTKSLTRYAVNSRLNIPISNTMYFGIGINFDFNDLKRETSYKEVISNSLQSVFTDTAIDDYTITETYQLIADRNYDISSAIYTIPTGLEYRLGKGNQVALRFGSIFQLYSQTIKDRKEITDSEPYTWIKEYSDGVTETNVYNDFFESTDQTTKETTSSTFFTYGLGYNPLDNLQIDLLGFFNSNASILDTDFYKNLQLSFTLKFD